MAGKFWSKKDVETLRELRAAGKSFGVIAEVLGRTEEAARIKAKRLGLDDDDQRILCSSSSDDLPLPAEIPSVETVLKIAVAAMMELRTPGLSKGEVGRLRSLVHSAGICQVRIGEYMDYRRIEAKLIDLDEKYERFVRERRKSPKC